jgi:hypothetical protein
LVFPPNWSAAGDPSPADAERLYHDLVETARLHLPLDVLPSAWNEAGFASGLKRVPLNGALTLAARYNVEGLLLTYVRAVTAGQLCECRATRRNRHGARQHERRLTRVAR